MSKVIVFDLDGTVISKGLESGVDQATKDVIKAAISKGHRLIAATGRRHSHASPIIEELGLRDNCICANGAQIVDPTTLSVVKKRVIEPADVSRLFEIMNGREYETVVTDGDLVENLNCESYKSEVVAAYVKSVPKDIAIDLVDELNTVDNIVCHVAHPWNTDHDNYYAIDINHKHATKRHALLELLDYDETSTVIGIGDSGNDLPLLEYADVKVVVEGAPDHVLEVADVVIAPPEQGGFVDYIKSLL